MVCVCKYMMSYIIISIANVASGFVEDHCQPVELKPHYPSISCLYSSSYPRTQSLFPFQAEVGMEIVTACTTYSLHSYCEVWEWPCVLSLPPWSSPSFPHYCSHQSPAPLKVRLLQRWLQHWEGWRAVWRELGSTCVGRCVHCALCGWVWVFELVHVFSRVIPNVPL